MKKLLLSLLALYSLCASAQAPATVDNHIRTLYGENYRLISVDTVAMPIRILISLDFALTLDLMRWNEEVKKIKNYTGEKRKRHTQALINNMDSTLRSYISIEEFIEMRDSNKPHKDRYYNYQRTIVYLETSGYTEEFYVRLGERSISMTRTEYDLKEERMFDNMRAAKETLEKLRGFLQMM